MAKKNEAKKIALGNGCGQVEIDVNGTNITVDKDGNVIVEANGSVYVDTKGEINARTTEGSVAAYSDKDVLHFPVSEPMIGDKMDDGTVFAGISPDTGDKMFVTPQDLSDSFNWKAAKRAAAALEAHGHNDYRLPSKAELNVLFENSSKIGGFNTGRSHSLAYYWSSDKVSYDRYLAWEQRFLNGETYTGEKSEKIAVRPVRSESGPS